MLLIDGKLATVTIPEAVMTTELAARLRDVAEQLMYETSVYVVLVQTTPPHFLHELVESDVTGHYSVANQVTMMLSAWSRIPQPIIAVIRGRCANVGLSFASLADFRFGAEETVFAHETMPLGGLSRRFSQLVGKGPAMHVLLGGHVMNADEAAMRGFLHVQSDAVTAANELAQRLCKQSPVAMNYTKESMLRGSDLTFQQALLQELDLYMLVQTSDDRLEGVAAYLQKRTPQFTGE